MSDQEKKSLWELLSQAHEIERRAEAGGEEFEAFLQTLESLDVQTREKIDGYKVVMTRLEDAAGFWMKRADEFDKVAESLQLAVQRIKDRMKEAMLAHGLKEIEGVEYRAMLTPAKAKLVVDAAQLSDEWRMPVTKLEIDKDRLRSTLENADVHVKGAHLEPSYALRFYVNNPNRRKS